MGISETCKKVTYRIGQYILIGVVQTRLPVKESFLIGRVRTRVPVRDSPFVLPHLILIRGIKCTGNNDTNNDRNRQ